MKKKNLVRVVSACLTGTLLAFSGCTQSAPPSEEDTPRTPEYTIDMALTEEYQANDELFAVKNVVKKEDNPLAGKTFYWLGSSVTYGSASQTESMADYLAAMTGCISKKEAVSGTTLYDDGGTGDSGVKSYTRRLTTSTVFDPEEKIDAFICQISTNDARSNRLSKWGSMTDETVFSQSSFNRATTLGGVEFIISYVIDTWNCPVYFYSGGYFGDDGIRKGTNPKGSDYGRLVDEVIKICKKWSDFGFEVGVIDLYHDAEFNAQATDEYYTWCMSDAIHPKRAGYLQWWTPYFENRLICDKI